MGHFVIAVNMVSIPMGPIFAEKMFWCTLHFMQKQKNVQKTENFKVIL